MIRRRSGFSAAGSAATTEIRRITAAASALEVVRRDGRKALGNFHPREKYRADRQTTTVTSDRRSLSRALNSAMHLCTVITDRRGIDLPREDCDQQTIFQSKFLLVVTSPQCRNPASGAGRNDWTRTSSRFQLRTDYRWIERAHLHPNHCTPAARFEAQRAPRGSGLADLVSNDRLDAFFKPAS